MTNELAVSTLGGNIGTISESALATLIEVYSGKLDGFTLGSDGVFVNRDYGYAVGVRSFPNASELAAFIVRNPNYYAGFWKDETGQPFFDAVRVIDNFETAVSVGIEDGQNCIWSFGRNAEVKL